MTGPGLAQPRDVWLRQALRELADARRVYFDLQSFAVGGARVRDVLRDQLEPLLDAAPDVAVIVVGTNDAIRGTPLPAVRRDLEAILRGALRRVPHVVVGGVGDLALIARVQWPLAGVLRVQGRAVNRVIWSVTAGFPNAHYIDVARADPDFRRGGRALFSDDLFHPNRDGHKLWADVARPVLDRAVR